MNGFRQRLIGKVDCVWIGCTADEAGQQNVVLWRAVRKLRGIPDRAQGADAGGTRDEKAETFEWIAYLHAAVGKRDYGNRRVGDLPKNQRSCGSNLSQKVS